MKVRNEEPYMENENAVKSNLLDAGCSDQSAAWVDQLVQAAPFIYV